MNMKVVLFVAMFVFALTGLVAAQNGIEPDLQQLTFNSPSADDPGIPDTVRIVGSNIPAGTTHFAVPVTLYNDEQIGGFNLPLKWDSPDIVCDSVSFVGSRIAYVNTKLFSIDNAAQRLQAGMIIFFEPNLGAGDGMIYTAYFSVNPGAADQVIAFDSTFYPPGGNFALTLGTGFNFIPQVNKGTVVLGNPATDPTITLDPTSFSFSAVQGGTNPPSQVLSITNTGAGTLDWTTTHNSSWLTVTPASGAGDGSPTVAVNITGLTAGTYRDTITVSDPAATNNPQKVPVVLNLAAPPPTIVLNPTSFSYTVTEGDPLASDQLSVTNSGGGTLNWTASDVAGWLTLSPTSGSGNAIITMSFNIASLPAGTYYDTITVSDPAATNNPQKSTVMLVIEEPPPAIVLTPTEFNYTITEGDDLADNQLAITNSGGGTLHWTASKVSSWLTLAPTSGTGTGIVTLSFGVAGLAAGTYYDTITVADPAASNSPRKATVTIVVEPPPPTIALSPTSFNYVITEGNGLADDQLNISNVGGSTLNWTASNKSVWMTLDPTSGSGGGAVTLSFDVTGLTAGVYADTITVSDPAATNSPQRAVVNLTVNSMPIPVISVDPIEFNFGATEGGANPPSQSLSITNIGDGTLEWTVSEAADWLDLTPLSGTGDGSVTVSVDMTGLAPGVYTTNITVSDPIASNSPLLVPVTFTIEALPVIAVDPSAFNYTITEGDALADDELAISNTGGGTLNWAVSNLTGWITLDPASGSGGGIVTLSFDVASVTAGIYYDTITVTDPTATNSPVKVPVMLTINEPPPVILLNHLTYGFYVTEGDLIPNEEITITNIGGGTLNWTATNNSSWVMVDPASGTGDGMVTVSFDITGVGPGFYVDTIFFADPAATNSPQYTIITLEVAEAPPDADTVYVETVGAFPGQQVMVGVSYVNFTTTYLYNLPLVFDPAVVNCDSVSFDGTRMVAMDESTVTIDNAAGTIDIYGFSIGGAILGPGSGLIAKMYFTVDGAATAQFVAIDTSLVNPFEFTGDVGGALKKTEFFSGGLDITDTPCFDFPTDTVVFMFDLGDIVPSISFPIDNTCGGILEWTVTDGADWLFMTPDAGNQFEDVTFNVDTTGLVPGVYETTATFESNGVNTPYTVVVILNLGAVPILSVTPDLIDFGQVCRGEILEGSFDIANVGYESLDWMADAVDAVVLSDHSGTAPSTVTFEIMTDMLDYGYHSLDVVVSSEEALHSPQMVTLKLYVVNCDECTFDIAEVDGPQGMPVGVPVYTNGIADVAGLQFNIGYDPAILAPDSVTSGYMAGPTIGFADNQVHYVWDDIVSPITVAQGETIMTLWFTVIGDIGQNSPLDWAGINEISDPYGIPYPGVVYCGGEVMVISSNYELTGTGWFADPYYDSSMGIPGVTVDLSGDASMNTMTNTFGEYLFADLASGDFMVAPSRADDDPGVSVADVIKIRRHIAVVESFYSPFQMIAGDVNNSGTVTVSDVVLIRRYLADLDVLPSGNWAFIDAMAMIDMDNWPTAPRTRDVTIAGGDVDMVDFYGVRMGDVNFTGYPYMPVPSGHAFVGVELTIPDLTATSSEPLDIPILVSNFNAVAGVEIHITYDVAYVVIDSITSAYMPDPTVNGGTGEAHIIWDDFTSPLTLDDGVTLAVLHTHILPGPSTVVTLGFTGRCELTDETGTPYDLVLNNGHLSIDLTDVDDNGSLLPLSLELKQNYPNPFNPSTTISYTVDKTMSLMFEVYNVSGQVVDRIDLGRKNAGVYAFTYYGNHLASGVYTYRLTGDGVSVARQMMLIK